MKARSLYYLVLMLVFAGCFQDRAMAQTVNDAAANGNVAAVRRFLMRDPRFANFVGADGNTPLHWAANNGHADMVSLLIAAGADVNKRRASDGWTPLFCAANAGHTECTRLLINAGADVRARANDNNTAMHWAAAGNHADDVKLLIEHGADVNARQNGGWTPLHSAASTAAAAAIRILLHNGADMEIRNNDGNAPIHEAALSGHGYELMLFLDNGQDIDVRNANGDTSLDIAARTGQTQVAKMLIGAGADLQARDKAGHTPREIALQNGKNDIAQALAQYQAALDERSARDAARQSSGIVIRGGYLNWAEPNVQAKVIYNNDFVSAKVGPEWSTSPLPGAQQAPLRVSTTPIGSRHFLGDFGSQAVRLTLKNLPSHKEISIDFELFIIRTWDGNNLNFGPDIWSLSVVDGPTLLYTTFGNTWYTLTKNLKLQSYPGEYPGDHYGLQFGAVETNTLGYTYSVDGQPVIVDSVYKLSYTFPHTGVALLLDFAATGLQELSDESWGIANVQVSVAAPATTLIHRIAAIRPTRVIARSARKPVQRRSVAQKPQTRSAPAKRSTRAATTKPAKRLHPKEKPPTP